MKGFSADWLALREPADAAARSPELTKRLAAFCADKEQLRILDLGSGTGSNLRFLAPHLKPAQSWTLVDHDEGLLALAAEAGKSLSGVEVVCRKLDLAKDLDSLDLSEVDLVTASALMDLVSAEWFDRLAAVCRAAGCAVFFVLTYDGVLEVRPSERLDPLIRELFNRHQNEDKGFGPALGPEAPKHMARALIAEGRAQRLDHRGRRAGAASGPARGLPRRRGGDRPGPRRGASRLGRPPPPPRGPVRRPPSSRARGPLRLSERGLSVTKAAL